MVLCFTRCLCLKDAIALVGQVWVARTLLRDVSISSSFRSSGIRLHCLKNDPGSLKTIVVEVLKPVALGRAIQLRPFLPLLRGVLVVMAHCGLWIYRLEHEHDAVCTRVDETADRVLFQDFSLPSL
jgi:hypothetical protein